MAPHFPFSCSASGCWACTISATGYGAGSPWICSGRPLPRLAIGAALGTALGTLVLYLRRTHQEAVGLDDFLALGLIALTYGLALACHAYGFLAVFAAGLALRRVERKGFEGGWSGRHCGGAASRERRSRRCDRHPKRAPAHMAQAVLTFNEQLERIGEVAVAVVVGAMLSAALFTWHVLWLAALLLLVIRPISVMIGLMGSFVQAAESAHSLAGSGFAASVLFIT